MSTPYEILGVYQDATLDQIKARYRLLARQHHPDVGGDPEAFQRIRDAYTALTAAKIEIPGEGLVNTLLLTETQKQGIKNRMARRLQQVEFQESHVESKVKNYAPNDPRIERLRAPLKAEREAIARALKALE